MSINEFLENLSEEFLLSLDGKQKNNLRKLLRKILNILEDETEQSRSINPPAGPPPPPSDEQDEDSLVG